MIPASRKKKAAAPLGLAAFFCSRGWWAVADLNRRLPPCEDGTLAAELTARRAPIIAPAPSASSASPQRPGRPQPLRRQPLPRPILLPSPLLHHRTPARIPRDRAPTDTPSTSRASFLVFPYSYSLTDRAPPPPVPGRQSIPPIRSMSSASHRVLDEPRILVTFNPRLMYRIATLSLLLHRGVPIALHFAALRGVSPDASAPRIFLPGCRTPFPLPS